MSTLDRPRASLSLLLLAATACAYGSAGTKPAAAPATVAGIDSVMAEFMALDLSPGAGVVVVRDTQVIYMKGFGSADVAMKRPFGPETAFYIASTTKSFTGLAAAILDQQGSFRLDVPLSQYLPGLRLKSPLNSDSITIRSLLAHTHGIGNAGPVTLRLAYTGEYNGNEELIRLLSEHSAARTGRAYSYGNVGYNVAALAMDAATKESWRETLQRTLFTPLGMTKTGAYISRYREEELATPYQFTRAGWIARPFGKTDANMQSAGGLVTTLRDMGTWLEAHINGGRIDGRQVLPAAAVAESHRNFAPMSANVRGVTQIGYGLGWQIVVTGEDTALVHGGGFPGFSTHMSFIPSRKVGVAVFANNAELGSGLVELAATRIYGVLLPNRRMSPDSTARVRELITRIRSGITADLERRASRPQNLPAPLDAYPGTFEHPLMGRMKITEVNGKLEARMGAAWSAVEVFDSAKNQLRVELFGNGEVVTASLKDGRVEALTFQGEEFRRVR